jgi:hypothetical protein
MLLVIVAVLLSAALENNVCLLENLLSGRSFEASVLHLSPCVLPLAPWNLGLQTCRM